MGNVVKIECVNCATTVEVEMGTSLVELAEKLALKGKYPLLAAYVNHKLKELNYRIYTPAKVEYFDISHLAGFRVYQRSLIFIMQAVTSTLYPGQKFHARHAIGDSLYCEVEGKHDFSAEECKALYETAKSVVAQNIPITREKLPTE
jgi:uridine kinase